MSHKVKIACVSFLMMIILRPSSAGLVMAGICGFASPCETFGAASAVFIGRPIGGTRSWQISRRDKTVDAFAGEIRFEIIEAFFGIKEKEIRVSAGTFDGQSVWYEAGDSWLIYARKKPDGRFETIPCGGEINLKLLDLSNFPEADTDSVFRGILEDAREHLKNHLRFLHDLLPGRKYGNWVQGQVFQIWRSRDPESKGQTIKRGIAGIKIRIYNEQRLFEVVTNDDGWYDSGEIPEEEYKIEIISPDRTLSQREAQRLRSASLNHQKCVQCDFYVTLGGRIRGRVLDTQSHPISGMRIDLMRKLSVNSSADDLSPRQEEFQYAVTDEAGQYEFQALPPDNYLLRLNPPGISPVFPYRTTYYPGVADIWQAEPIHLEMNQRKEGIDFYLEAQAQKISLSGVVVWPDGSPAINAEVWLDIPKESLSSVGKYGNKTATDREGKFTVNGLKGEQYRLRVFWRSGENLFGMPTSGPPGVEFAESEPMMFTLLTDISELRIVLSRVEKAP